MTSIICFRGGSISHIYKLGVLRHFNRMAGRVIHYVKSQYVDGLPDPAAVKLLAAEHVD